MRDDGWETPCLQLRHNTKHQPDTDTDEIQIQIDILRNMNKLKRLRFLTITQHLKDLSELSVDQFERVLWQIEVSERIDEILSSIDINLTPARYQVKDLSDFWRIEVKEKEKLGTQLNVLVSKKFSFRYWSTLRNLIVDWKSWEVWKQWETSPSFTHRGFGSRLGIGVYTASLIPATHQNYITCGWIQSVRISLAPPSAASQVMRWMSSAESANQIWFPEGSHEGFSVTISLFGGERRRMADLILIQSLTQDSVLDNQLQMERELLWHQLVNSEQFDWSWIKSRQHSPFVFVTEQFLRLLRPAAIFLRLIDKREQLQSVLILDPARSEWGMRFHHKWIRRSNRRRWLSLIDRTPMPKAEWNEGKRFSDKSILRQSIRIYFYRRLTKRSKKRPRAESNRHLKETYEVNCHLTRTWQLNKNWDTGNMLMYFVQGDAMDFQALYKRAWQGHAVQMATKIWTFAVLGREIWIE